VNDIAHVHSSEDGQHLGLILLHIRINLFVRFLVNGIEAVSVGGSVSLFARSPVALAATSHALSSGLPPCPQGYTAPKGRLMRDVT